MFSAESEDVNSCKKKIDEGFQTTDAGPPCRYKWGPSGQQYNVMECCNFWVKMLSFMSTSVLPVLLGMFLLNCHSLVSYFAALMILPGMEVSWFEAFSFRLKLPLWLGE
jgi:hypothetical protein